MLQSIAFVLSDEKVMGYSQYLVTHSNWLPHSMHSGNTATVSLITLMSIEDMPYINIVIEVIYLSTAIKVSIHLHGTLSLAW